MPHLYTEFISPAKQLINALQLSMPAGIRTKYDSSCGYTVNQLVVVVV